MTRDELIEKLKRLPEGAELLVDHPGCGCCSSGYGLAVLVKETGEDGRALFRFAHQEELG